MTNRGLAFEDQVWGLLRALRDSHPTRVETSRQPEVKEGQIVIARPDFDLIMTKLSAKYHYYVECQARKRFDWLEIARKAREVRACTKRHTFVFVYSGGEDAKLERRLDKRGIQAYCFDQFVAFLDAHSKELELVEREVAAQEAKQRAAEERRRKARAAEHEEAVNLFKETIRDLERCSATGRVKYLKDNSTQFLVLFELRSEHTSLYQQLRGMYGPDGESNAILRMEAAIRFVSEQERWKTLKIKDQGMLAR